MGRGCLGLSGDEGVNQTRSLCSQESAHTTLAPRAWRSSSFHPLYPEGRSHTCLAVVGTDLLPSGTLPLWLWLLGHVPSLWPSCPVRSLEEASARPTENLSLLQLPDKYGYLTTGKLLVQTGLVLLAPHPQLNLVRHKCPECLPKKNE